MKDFSEGSGEKERRSGFQCGMTDAYWAHGAFKQWPRERWCFLVKLHKLSKCSNYQLNKVLAHENCSFSSELKKSREAGCLQWSHEEGQLPHLSLTQL